MTRLPVWFERAENLAIGAAVLAAFVHLHFSWWWLPALFIGDTMTTRNVLTGATGPKPAPFTLQPEQAMTSLARLGELDATWVLPGHGPAWNGGAAEAVRLTLEAAAQ